jgi:hypothetical protein
LIIDRQYKFTPLDGYRARPIVVVGLARPNKVTLCYRARVRIGESYEVQQPMVRGSRLIFPTSGGPLAWSASWDRMVSVLDAISRDRALPPIEVLEAIGDACSYRLYHGRHRLAASIAVGFTLIPAVVVRDLDDIKRDEGMA